MLNTSIYCTLCETTLCFLTKTHRGTSLVSPWFPRSIHARRIKEGTKNRVKLPTCHQPNGAWSLPLAEVVCQFVRFFHRFCLKIGDRELNLHLATFAGNGGQSIDGSVNCDGKYVYFGYKSPKKNLSSNAILHEQSAHCLEVPSSKTYIGFATC